MSRYLEPAEVPYGAYWCPRCVAFMACEVAAGHLASDPDCALECMTCNTRIGEVTDVVQTYPFPPMETTRMVLTPEERARGRERGRQMALGVFEPPLPGPPPQAIPAPPPDFLAREAARIASMRGRS